MTTPGNFDKSISAKLKNLSESRGATLNEMRRQFTFERFLTRVFAEPDNGWVLKGGIGLLIRLPNARFSKDVDLYNKDNSIEAAVADLRTAAAQSGDDHFRFDITKEVPMSGPVDGVTLSVTARIGAKPFQGFTIDLTTKLSPVAPELVTPEPMILDPRLTVNPIRLYPIADHIADKICAMYSIYNATGAASTRYRDLVDLVLIIEQHPIDPTATAAAITAEAKRRQILLPSSVVAPGPQWSAGYPAEARRLRRLSPHLHHLDRALAFVGATLNPLLPQFAPFPASAHRTSELNDATRSGFNQSGSSSVPG